MFRTFLWSLVFVMRMMLLNKHNESSHTKIRNFLIVNPLFVRFDHMMVVLLLRWFQSFHTVELFSDYNARKF